MRPTDGVAQALGEELGGGEVLFRPLPRSLAAMSARRGPGRSRRAPGAKPVR
jgi:hypothetical protein